MKYYAVTEDPNELFHYGRLGMKWGKHIFGEERKPKSPGYKRAVQKLRANLGKTAKAARSTMKNVKANVQKSAEQHAINRRLKQENKFNKAVEKSQRRINAMESLRTIDQMKQAQKDAVKASRAENRYNKRVQKGEQRMALLDNLRDVNQDHLVYKEMRKADRAEAKQERKYLKNEKHMEKYMQQARTGQLKYGKLSEDQIRRIGARLNMENATRAMGGREKPKFKTRMKEAIQEGTIQGTIAGTSTAINEITKAKVQNRLKNKRVLDKKSRQQAEREHEATRIKNQKSNKEIRDDIMREAYELEVREGTPFWKRGDYYTSIGAAKRIKAIEGAKEQRKLELEDKRNEEKWKIDQAHNEQKWLTDQKHNRLQEERNNREKAKREEQKLLEEGRRAYEYGYTGSNPQNKNANGEAAPKAKYYEQKVIKGMTLQEEARINAEREAREQERKRREQEQKRLEDERRAREAQERQSREDLNRRMREQEKKAQAFERQEQAKREQKEQYNRFVRQIEYQQRKEKEAQHNMITEAARRAMEQRRQEKAREQQYAQSQRDALREMNGGYQLDPRTIFDFNGRGRNRR